MYHNDSAYGVVGPRNINQELGIQNIKECLFNMPSFKN